MIEPVVNNPLIETIKEESARFQELCTEVRKVIVGHQDVIDFIITALLCNGHILLEGVPGVAKTTMVKSITQALGLSFNRIQFTPDLLPADLIGSPVFNTKINDFETKKGPIFAHLILADEINRAPAKVQAALLEAMQERQVTIGSTTFTLEKPFIVFATQNPVEQEGTYRLPEAQIDRFMFKLLVRYPSIQEEREILNRSSSYSCIQRILSKDQIFQAQATAAHTYTDEKIIDYIVNIIFATRTPGAYSLNEIVPLIHYGASPRATLALNAASKAYAFLHQRHFVTPDDVKAVAYEVLRHRINLTYEAEADNISADEIIQKILQHIPAP